MQVAPLPTQAGAGAAGWAASGDVGSIAPYWGCESVPNGAGWSAPASGGRRLELSARLHPQLTTCGSVGSDSSTNLGDWWPGDDAGSGSAAAGAPACATAGSQPDAQSIGAAAGPPRRRAGALPRGRSRLGGACVGLQTALPQDDPGLQPQEKLEGGDASGPAPQAGADTIATQEDAAAQDNDACPPASAAGEDSDDDLSGLLLLMETAAALSRQDEDDGVDTDGASDCRSGPPRRRPLPGASRLALPGAPPAVPPLLSPSGHAAFLISTFGADQPMLGAGEEAAAATAAAAGLDPAAAAAQPVPLSHRARGAAAHALRARVAAAAAAAASAPAGGASAGGGVGGWGTSSGVTTGGSTGPRGTSRRAASAGAAAAVAAAAAPDAVVLGELAGPTPRRRRQHQQQAQGGSGGGGGGGGHLRDAAAYAAMPLDESGMPLQFAAATTSAPARSARSFSSAGLASAAGSLPNLKPRGQGRWQVFLCAQGLKYLYVGQYDSLDEAKHARDLAVLAVHGPHIVPTLAPASLYNQADVEAVRVQMAAKPAARAVMVTNGLWPPTSEWKDTTTGCGSGGGGGGAASAAVRSSRLAAARGAAAAAAAAAACGSTMSPGAAAAAAAAAGGYDDCEPRSRRQPGLQHLLPLSSVQAGSRSAPQAAQRLTAPAGGAATSTGELHQLPHGEAAGSDDAESDAAAHAAAVAAARSAASLSHGSLPLDMHPTAAAAAAGDGADAVDSTTTALARATIALQQRQAALNAAAAAAVSGPRVAQSGARGGAAARGTSSLDRSGHHSATGSATDIWAEQPLNYHARATANPTGTTGIREHKGVFEVFLATPPFKYLYVGRANSLPDARRMKAAAVLAVYGTAVAAAQFGVDAAGVPEEQVAAMAFRLAAKPAAAEVMAQYGTAAPPAARAGAAAAAAAAVAAATVLQQQQVQRQQAALMPGWRAQQRALARQQHRAGVKHQHAMAQSKRPADDDLGAAAGTDSTFGGANGTPDGVSPAVKRARSSGDDGVGGSSSSYLASALSLAALLPHELPHSQEQHHHSEQLGSQLLHDSAVVAGDAHDNAIADAEVSVSIVNVHATDASAAAAAAAKSPGPAAAAGGGEEVPSASAAAGVLGVRVHKGCYEAFIASPPFRYMYIGLYRTLQQAVDARNAALIVLFGPESAQAAGVDPPHSVVLEVAARLARKPPALAAMRAAGTVHLAGEAERAAGGAAAAALAAAAQQAVAAAHAPQLLMLAPAASASPPPQPAVVSLHQSPTADADADADVCKDTDAVVAAAAAASSSPHGSNSPPSAASPCRPAPPNAAATADTLVHDDVEMMAATLPLPLPPPPAAAAAPCEAAPLLTPLPTEAACDHPVL